VDIAGKGDALALFKTNSHEKEIYVSLHAVV
jgi:hypothetical protein